MHRILAPSMFSALVVFAVLAAGCGQRPKPVDSSDSPITTYEVDIQDLKRAASEMLESLLKEGVLQTVPQPPAKIRVELVKNDSGSSFDVGELTYRMREHLVNSGQAAVVTAYGENPESPEAQAKLKREAFNKGKSSVETLDPDFFLNGKITRLQRSIDRDRQITYTFRLTLTRASTGLEAWTKPVDITKQGTKPAFGR